MRILIVGGGAREHALARGINECGHAVACAGGNPAWSLGEEAPVGWNDPPALAAWSEEAGIDLAVVGPEAPLYRGVADELRLRGVRVLGPDRAGARLEEDKAWAKRIFRKAGLPTAEATLHQTMGSFLGALESAPTAVVVKANGPAAGKGVAVCDSHDEAEAFARTLFDSGHAVLLEQRLEGREASLMVLADGRRTVPLPLSQDYKRLLDGDLGPNTGGMGAMCPVSGDAASLSKKLAQPLLKALNSEGIDYRGVLYLGLMLTDRGPFVLECNVRFGDPETQAVLPLIDEDLGELFMRAATGTLPDRPLKVLSQDSVAVVLAERGYPQAPETGRPISGIDRLEAGIRVSFAGVRQTAEGWVTAGGRVLTVQASADGLANARQKAMRAADTIDFDGKCFRRDIAACG